MDGSGSSSERESVTRGVYRERKKRSRATELRTVVVLLVAVFAFLVSPLMSPAVVARDCGWSDYQTADASVQTAFGLLQYMHVAMRRWLGVSCDGHIHMMEMYTRTPSHWTLNTGTGDSVVHLTVSLPSWSLFSTVAGWYQVGGCSVYVTADSGTGSGYSTAAWRGEIFWPCPSGTVGHGHTYTYTWSGHSGENYVITFTMQDNPPFGITRSTTLT